jgi:DUF4097 and DUF4098 domain-containing protein YvlB
MLKRAALSVLFVVALGAAVAAAEQPYEEYFDQTYAVSSTAAVSLENVNGDVSIDVWDHDEVRVQAVKKASSPELLAKLEIDVAASGDAVRIDTDYQRTDEHGHRSVEYTLMVPRAARIQGVDLVNGNLTVSGVQGGVEADCVNGSMVIHDVAGAIDLESVNGSIECTAGSNLGDSVSLAAVNGTIDLHLAPGTSAHVNAETVNGKLSNDLGLEVIKGKYVGATMSGTIGGGGATVDLETVNGAIAVHGG